MPMVARRSTALMPFRKYRAPREPFSSAPNATKTTVYGVGTFLIRAATSSSRPTPDALST